MNKNLIMTSPIVFAVNKLLKNVENKKVEE